MAYQNFQINSQPQLNIHHWPAQNSSHTILCVQGLGGHGGYYQWLAEEMNKKNISVVAFDLRGHGYSEGKKGDIESFSEYCIDLMRVFNELKDKFPEQKIHILGESMGSSIVTHALLKDSLKTESLLFVSPVLEPFMSFSIKEVIKFILWAPINRSKPVLNLRGNEEKGCRDQAFNEYLRADKLFMEKASVRFMAKLSFFMNSALKNIQNLEYPIAVFQPQNDKVTRYKTLKKTFEKLPQKKAWVLYPEAFHCLTHDPMTPQMYRDIEEWVKSF
jgi:alpha-beta hydrolase superfamily lysophospholipase